MPPKNCDQCSHLFVPHPAGGLKAVFCKACYIQCEQSYLEIRHFLQSHPRASAAKIAIETGIPTAFIYHLFRIGRFIMDSPFAADRHGRKQGHCTECKKPLKVYFDALCDACDESLMHSAPGSEKAVEGIASSFAPARSTRRRRERSQYGFNRR